jgi:hypothetical protein
MWKFEIPKKLLSEILNVKENAEDQDVGGRIILICILLKLNLRVWNNMTCVIKRFRDISF